MNETGETPGLNPDKLQEPVENTDSSPEVAQGLRDRIEDPQELRKFCKKNNVKSGKWENETTEVLEAYHKKYEQWPGSEEEERQIKEYLGEGHGSKWQAKTLDRYHERFTEGSIEREKWDETAFLVRDELRHERLGVYKAKARIKLREEKDKLLELSDRQQTVGDRISSTLESKAENSEATPKAEVTSNIKVEGETRAKEKRETGPNEDAILVDNEKRIYGVFDGMGGSDRPAEASAMAVQIIGENIGSDEQYSSPEEVQTAVQKALEKSDKDTHEKIGDGGTTATVVKIWEQDGNKILVWANAGDSRLFLLREGESIRQVTVDDSEITQKVEAGEITELVAEVIDQASTSSRLNGEMRKLFSDRRYITNCLGGGDAIIKTGFIHLKTGDKAALTSDGIHDNLTKQYIESTLRNAQHPAKALVEEAAIYSRQKRFRSKVDDMSAVVIEVPSNRDRFADFPDMGN